MHLRVPPPSQLLLKKVLTPLTPVTMETFVKVKDSWLIKHVRFAETDHVIY